MDFMKVVENVQNGKVARLSGTAAELRQAREAIGCLLNGDHRVTVKRGSGCLYVYESDPLVLVPLAQIPRQ